MIQYRCTGGRVAIVTYHMYVAHYLNIYPPTSTRVLKKPLAVRLGAGVKKIRLY